MATQGSPVGRYLECPTKEAASRYTRELNYSERLSATTIIKGVGTRFQDFYGICQLGDRLETGEAFMSNGGSLEFAPDALVSWLREVVGDEELAEAVQHAEEVLPVASVAQDAISVIIRSRVAQYREVLTAQI